MPCSDYPQGSVDNTHYYRAERNKLASMLCYACQLLAKNGVIVNKGELFDWWKEHQQQDAKRADETRIKARKESIRERLMTQLTDEEKEALNLK